MNLQEQKQRQIAIIKLRASGSTLKQIGVLYNLSHQRVSQIIKKDYTGRTYKHNAFWDARPKWQNAGRERTRELVRHRDNYTCQNCLAKWVEGKRRFDIHHLNGLCGKLSRKYDPVSDLSGLITLCRKCHFNHPQHSKTYKQ